MQFSRLSELKYWFCFSNLKYEESKFDYFVYKLYVKGVSFRHAAMKKI